MRVCVRAHRGFEFLAVEPHVRDRLPLLPVPVVRHRGLRRCHVGRRHKSAGQSCIQAAVAGVRAGSVGVHDVGSDGHHNCAVTY